MKLTFLYFLAIMAMVSCTSTTDNDTAETTATAMTEDVTESINSEFSNPTIQFGVVVSDMEKSLAFYKDIIGMVEVGGFDIDEAFGKTSGLTGGEPFSVKILKLEDSEAANQFKMVSFGNTDGTKSTYIQDDVGVQYTTIFVKSMKPFLERLAANNIPLLGDTPTTLGDGRRFVLIQDPDGIFIELIGGE